MCPNFGVHAKFNIDKRTLESYTKRTDFELISWSEVCDRTRSYYDQYKALLEGNIRDGNFLKKEDEVKRHHDIERTNSVHLGVEARKVTPIKKRGKEIIGEMKKIKN